MYTFLVKFLFAQTDIDRWTDKHSVFYLPRCPIYFDIYRTKPMCNILRKYKNGAMESTKPFFCKKLVPKCVPKCSKKGSKCSIK